MKKMLAVAAICMGVFVFTNANFAEASTKYDEESKSADQQIVTSSTIQSTDVNAQQLSTKYDEESK